MPSPWALIDSSFPAFDGGERAKEQIPVILDYMYMLSEGLKYQLSNLNAKNFNTTALKNLKIETTADLVEQMTVVTADISTAINRLNALAAQIAQAELDIGYLEKQQEDTGESLGELDERVTSAEGWLQALEEVIQTDGAGGATIGAEEKELHLVGKVYINGVLIE